MPPSAVQLRDYQRDAIDAIYAWFDANSEGNPLVVVPTGGGKSVILAEFVREVITDVDPKSRILVVTHVKELIAQNHAALVRSWPEGFLRVGIYSAGLKRRDNRAQVVVAGVQSVFRRAAELGHFDLVIVDEAHLIPASGYGMYRTLLAGLKEINHKVRMVGLTATPFRTDSGALDRGNDRMFHAICYDCDIVRLIDEGWLSPITNQGVSDSVEIDTRDVGHRAGEFIAADLEAAATKGDIVERAVDEMVRRAGDRQAWLVFCCGLGHARRVQDALRARRVECETVFGETDYATRDDIIDRYRNRALRCIVNVGVLTTGFDAPHVDLIALLRPTESPGLYVQMCGRGLRRAEGKADCLVLDFGGNIMRHGPIDRVLVRQPSGGGNVDFEPPMRKCPMCQRYCLIAQLVCPCGYEFPRSQEAKHEERPDGSNPLLAGLKRGGLERWTVQRVIYSEWVNRQKGTVTLRVYYASGFHQNVSEWVCFEHPEGSFPRRKAEAWWRERGGQLPAPETVDLARVRIELGEIRKPVEIVVDTRGEHPEIKGCKFEREPGEDDGPAASTKAAARSYDDIPF